jgi:hypothetical protein
VTKKIQIVLSTLALTLFFSTGALADLVLADGGASGSFFNIDRSGEGIFVEISELSDDSNMISVAWFTFDQSGNQMWMSGAVAIDKDQREATISVSTFDGPVFGFGSGTLMEHPWGTLTLVFPTCDDAILSYASTAGYGSDTVSQIRLTKLEQVKCDEPIQDPDTSRGQWSGPGTCFNVADDGLSLTESGSTCALNSAFISEIDGETAAGENCSVDIDCEGTITIVDGNFSCYSEIGNITMQGTFLSNTEATGTIMESEAFDSVCTGVWTATPDN